MPSEREPFGIVTAESIQHAAPVMARNTTASEIIGTDGKAGIILTPKNEMSEGLSYADRVLTEPNFLYLQSMGALERAKKFDPQTLVEEFVDYIYEQN
jgi:glycosyltransferase involved in cell wall biosynthesis